MNTRNKAEVLREDIDAIVARVGDGDLELPRKIGVAIEGMLVGGLTGGSQLAVHEDLEVRSRRRLEGGRDPINRLGQRAVGSLGLQARAGDDVADDIAAGTERGHEVRMEAPREVLQRRLGDPVELHRLSGGETERVVGELARNRVEGQPLRRGDPTAGNGHPDHEAVVELLLGHRPGTSSVAIVLGVDPVKLEQLLCVSRHVRLCGAELVEQRAAQVSTLALHALDGGLRGGGFAHFCSPRCWPRVIPPKPYLISHNSQTPPSALVQSR